MCACMRNSIHYFYDQSLFRLLLILLYEKIGLRSCSWALCVSRHRWTPFATQIARLQGRRHGASFAAACMQHAAACMHFAIHMIVHRSGPRSFSPAMLIVFVCFSHTLRAFFAMGNHCKTCIRHPSRWVAVLTLTLHLLPFSFFPRWRLGRRVPHPTSTMPPHTPMPTVGGGVRNQPPFLTTPINLSIQCLHDPPEPA